MFKVKHILAAAMILGAASAVQAATIEFDLVSPTSGDPSFVYDPSTGLSVGAGLSAADGGSTLDLTVGLIPSAIFGDVYMTISPDPLPVTAPATTTLPSGGGVAYTQALAGGTFTLDTGTTGTKNGSAFANKTLLTGTFSNDSITLLNSGGSTTGSFSANTVVYNGGYIYTTYFPPLLNPGDFVFTLGSIVPAPATLTGGFLSGFSAGSTGQFDASPPGSHGPTTPLPASVLSGSALLGLVFAAKAWKRRDNVA